MTDTDHERHENARIVFMTVTAVGAFLMGSALAAGQALRIAPGNRVLGVVFALTAFGLLMLEGRDEPTPTEYVLKPDTADMDDASNYIWNVTVEYPATDRDEVFTVRTPRNVDPEALKWAANDMIQEGEVVDVDRDYLWSVDTDTIHADR